ncbi:MAG: metallophosphoesterase [Nitrospirota bacterium]
MRLFLIVFFVVYGGLHLYAFSKVRAAAVLNVFGAAALALFMLVMTAAPVIIRVSENHGYETFARIMAHVGYTWMGVLFLFCSVSAAIDLYRLVIHAEELIMRKNLSLLIPSARVALVVPLSLSLLIALYGYFEAKDIRAERLVITTPKLPPGVEKLTIVQISDVHLGLVVREERLKKILALVKEADPDIFVSTGDLVDGQLARLNGLAEMIGAVTPRYGKFAILGNHEYYAGLDQAIAFTERAGFTLLRGEAAAGVITVAGVDDSAGKAFSGYRPVSESGLLAGLPRDRFTLFLKHRPVLDKESRGLFDLQLSGHVHKGQIFPFSILTYLYYPVHSGYSPLPGGSRLYVSRGSGTWGPPIRFLAPPEVTIIELVSGSGTERGKKGAVPP